MKALTILRLISSFRSLGMLLTSDLSTKSGRPIYFMLMIKIRYTVPVRTLKKCPIQVIYLAAAGAVCRLSWKDWNHVCKSLKLAFNIDLEISIKSY